MVTKSKKQPVKIEGTDVQDEYMIKQVLSR